MNSLTSDPQTLEPHTFEQDTVTYEVRFTRGPEAWIARIRRAGEATAQIVAFPHGRGYDADDVRASLIAGCEAAVPTLPWAGVTRH